MRYSGNEDLVNFINNLKGKFLVEQSEMDFGEGKLGLLARYEFFKYMENVINYYLKKGSDEELFRLFESKVVSMDVEVTSKMWVIMITEYFLERGNPEEIQKLRRILAEKL